MRAKLVFRHKYTYSDDAIMEVKVWQLPKSDPQRAEGFKYSMVYISPRGERLFGYDNAEGKGHHRHESQNETPVSFVSMDELIQRFLKEIQAIRRKHHED